MKPVPYTGPTIIRFHRKKDLVMKTFWRSGLYTSDRTITQTAKDFAT
jgi:hypothetical protein